MEATYDIAVSLAIAAAILSLFAILRLAFRSPSAPSWATDTVPAYFIALLMTYAVAASLFYLAYTLSSAIPGWAAFFATFAIHIGLVAAFLKVMPSTEGEVAGTQRAPSQGVAA
jgi:hypothetical protein